MYCWANTTLRNIHIVHILQFNFVLVPLQGTFTGTRNLWRNSVCFHCRDQGLTQALGQVFNPYVTWLHMKKCRNTKEHISETWPQTVFFKMIGRDNNSVIKWSRYNQMLLMRHLQTGAFPKQSGVTNNVSIKKITLKWYSLKCAHTT